MKGFFVGRVRRGVALLMVIVVVSCLVKSGHAISFGGPGGTWPATWPKALEPLRKQAWTWEHGFGGLSYDIPFQSREEFEAAWPHLLKLKSQRAAITLVRGKHLRVKEQRSAGVRVVMPRPGTTKGPLSQTSITLVVDGKIVDLNRISLPADTPLMDRRFED